MGVDVDHADRTDGRRAVALVQSGARWVSRIAAHELNTRDRPQWASRTRRLVGSLRIFRELLAQHPVSGDQSNAGGVDRGVSGTGELG